MRGCVRSSSFLYEGILSIKTKYDVYLRQIENISHYSSIEYSTLLVYSVLMPLSGTINSTEPIIDDAHPDDGGGASSPPAGH